MNLFDLRRLSTHYFNTFSQLQMLANRKREVDENAGLDFDSRKRLLGSIKTQVSRVKIADFAEQRHCGRLRLVLRMPD
jgi:hypothetical protein